jgi:hypothetical protein
MRFVRRAGYADVDVDVSECACVGHVVLTTARFSEVSRRG